EHRTHPGLLRRARGREVPPRAAAEHGSGVEARAQGDAHARPIELRAHPDPPAHEPYLPARVALRIERDALRRPVLRHGPYVEPPGTDEWCEQQPQARARQQQAAHAATEPSPELQRVTPSGLAVALRCARPSGLARPPGLARMLVLADRACGSRSRLAPTDE